MTTPPALATPSHDAITRTRDAPMMRALVRTRYGGPEALAIIERPRPTPRPDEVLIRTRAAAINPADWIFLTGSPRAVRLMTGLWRPKQPVLGLDVAGEVVAVGAQVTRFVVGEAVFGEGSGTFAQYVCVAQDQLARKPLNVSFEDAAATPVAALPALRALRDIAQLKPGQRALILGASGGVGTFAVQLAHTLGAEVTGVCSTRNVAMVRALGAAHVIDYTREHAYEAATRYDAILDLVGGATVRQWRRLLTPTGVYISSVGRAGWSLRALIASWMPGPRIKVLAARADAEALDALSAHLATGALSPVITHRYTLDEAPEALRAQGAGHARGKSILMVSAALS